MLFRSNPIPVLFADCGFGHFACQAAGAVFGHGGGAGFEVAGKVAGGTQKRDEATGHDFFGRCVCLGGYASGLDRREDLFGKASGEVFFCLAVLEGGVFVLADEGNFALRFLQRFGQIEFEGLLVGLQPGGAALGFDDFAVNADGIVFGGCFSVRQVVGPRIRGLVRQMRRRFRV